MNKRNILALATTMALAASPALLFSDAAHGFNGHGGGGHGGGFGHGGGGGGHGGGGFGHGGGGWGHGGGGHGGGGWAHGGGGGWGQPRYYSGRSSYSRCYRWSPRRGGWVNVCARPYYDW